MSALIPCLYAAALIAAAVVLSYWAGRRHERVLLTSLLSLDKWFAH